MGKADISSKENKSQSAQAKPKLNELLEVLVKEEGSDLHLKVGEPPVIRIDGRLKRLEYPTLSPKDIEEIAYNILDERQKNMLETEKELDMAYSLAGTARFRVNVFLQNSKLGLVFRFIPPHPYTIDELGLPSILKDISLLPRGLVLVTGPTGSGKSTTLAAIIEHINSTRSCHIVTVEDPIEYVHRDKLSAINQRELGVDTLSFAEALKHILRQSPDVILVGELRDLDTMALAVTAAETGHLVLATLHTTDAIQTVDRMIDVFPPEQQAQIRLQVSMNLQAVISQTLVPRLSSKGRVAAFEFLICHPGVRNVVREGKTHQIFSLIQTGGNYGMTFLDKSLEKLVQDKVVSFEDALTKCSNPVDFAKKMGKPFS